MRISVWQQFSSNHSSHFTVVGRFGSEVEAHEAVEKFRYILKTITDWQSVPENSEWIELQHRPPDENVHYATHPPTPPEIEFARQYDVDWGYAGIDWIGGNPDERIRQIGQDVFVSVRFETWNPPTPIENLMARFGGAVQVQVSESMHLHLHLTCNLPNEAEANNLLQQVELYFAKPIGKPEPWKRKDGYEAISAYGRIELDGKQITIDCEFFHLDPGLSAMVEWLKRVGASDIEYMLIEKPY